MKLGGVQQFLAVARLGGIRPASRALGITQPALTKSMRRLEHEIGAPLFSRTVKGTSLTVFGERFLARASLIASELKRSADEIAQLRGEKEGSMRVSISPAAAVLVLPVALMRFRKEFSAVRLHIADLLYPEVLDSLRSGSLEFAVGPYPTAPLAEDLVIQTLFENRSVVIVRKGHPRADAKSIRELWDMEWVFAASSEGPGSVIAELFSDSGLLPPKVLTRTESFLPLVPLVAETNLVGVVPEQLLWSTPAAARIRVVNVKESLHLLRISLITRKASALTPAAASLVKNLHWAARLAARRKA